jgi:hypothetical protein
MVLLLPPKSRAETPEGYPCPVCTLYALASLRATPARNALYDLYLFAGTGVLDKVAQALEVDPAELVE